MNAQTVAVSGGCAIRSPAPKNHCGFHDFDGLFEFGVTPVQRPDSFSGRAGDSITITAVDLY